MGTIEQGVRQAVIITDRQTLEIGSALKTAALLMAFRVDNAAQCINAQGSHRN